jgi:hypothetical protein
MPSTKVTPARKTVNEHQLLAGDFCGLHPRQRCLDLNLGQRKIARHLVAQQHPDLLEKFTERFCRAGFVAKERELVLDQGMIDDGDAFHGKLLKKRSHRLKP